MIEMQNSEYAEIEIPTPRGRIVARSAGHVENELVVAVHGWSQRNGWFTWEPLMKPLSLAGLFVVCLDMPGWGDTPPWMEGPLDTNLAVEALSNVIDYFEKRSACFMGKSWGGGIVLKWALEFPDRASKLILSAPAVQELDLLKAISMPVLLTWAKDDPVIPFQNSDEYLKRIPNLDFVPYESGGHSAGPKNADDFAPKVIHHIKSDNSIRSEIVN